MIRKAALLISILLLAGLSITPAAAQGGVPLLAFVNSSGQLVVAGADGAYRWIVTNPGEYLQQTLGYSWSSDGNDLFFALDLGGEVSLKIGDVSSQTTLEIGRLSGAVSGGEWLGSGVLLADGSSLYFANNDGLSDSGSFPATLTSPFANTRPNLPASRSVGSDSMVLMMDASGLYTLLTRNGNTPLGLVNDENAPLSGLWSDDLVAYWGYDNNGTGLAVTSANSLQTASLSSGTSIPITPLTWIPGTTFLIYQSAGGTAQIADVSCLESGCSANPLENGVPVLPASATDVQTDGRWVYFRDGEGIYALDLASVSNDAYIGSALLIGNQAAPQTWMHASDGRVVYTAYTRDARDPNDREVRAVDLSCVSQQSCQPSSLLPGAVAGLVSPDGRYVVVDLAGSGLNVLDIDRLALNYLSGSLGGALGTGLSSARWNS